MDLTTKAAQHSVTLAHSLGGQTATTPIVTDPVFYSTDKAMALLMFLLLVLVHATRLFACSDEPAMAANSLRRDASFGDTSFGAMASCADASWPPVTVGTDNQPQLPDDELRAMLAQIDPARIQATILKLVSFGTRHTLSVQNSTTRGIGAARDWIAAELRTYAAVANDSLTVEVQSYTQGVASRIPFPVKISNVLATLKGAGDDGRVYVITGHYDSRVTDVLNYTDDAPGANDDASGVAVMMELCRILSTSRPSATIIFGAVAGEENGLYGSDYMAKVLKNSSTNVEAMLNNDIIGSSTGDQGQKDPYTIRVFAEGPPSTESTSKAAERLSIGGENDSPARELARFATEVGANNDTGMQIAIMYRLDRFLRGGYHSSFLKQGFPAVRFTEPNENFEHQHQDVRVVNNTQYGDLPEFVDYDFVARVGKVNMATLWSLSQSPGWVQNVTIDTSTLSNDSLLRWTRKAGAARYEVVYRPTDAPLWTHVLDVGNADSAVLPLSKDNIIFGVRAVGANGYRGPASYPFPTVY